MSLFTKQLCITAALAILFSSGIIRAKGNIEPKPNSSQSVKSIIVTQKKSNTNNKPKAPSAQYIECWYESGTLTFDFAIPEGECELTICEENGVSSQYRFDSSSTAQVYVGEMWNASIEIVSETGHSYEGWLGD